MVQLCKVLKVKARQLQLWSAASSLREVRSSTEHNAAGFAGSEAEQCVAALRASSCETEYCWPALWQLLPESRCGPGTRATVGAGTVPGPFPVLHCATGATGTVHCATGKGPRCQYSVTPGTPGPLCRHREWYWHITAQGKPPPPGIGKTQIGPSMQNHQSKETIKLSDENKVSK